MWIAAVSVASAGLTVDVDSRVELLQAVYHAIGAEEFSGGDPEFVEALDRLFTDHLDHAALVGARRSRAAWSIGYNAPAGLAVHLDRDLRLTVPLRPFPSAELDDRWDHGQAVVRWLRDVQRFRIDVGWDAFFAAQEARLAGSVEAARTSLATEALPDWFAAAFGGEPEVRVHLSPLSGNNNFAASVHRTDGLFEQHAVVGATSGWGEGALRVLVHEVAHGYANPAAARAPALQEGARAVMPLVADQMRAAAYADAETVALETLTRAVTLLYLRDRHPAWVERQLAEDEHTGFAWIAAAMDALAAARRGPAIDLAAGAEIIGQRMTEWAALPPEDRLAPFRGTVNGAFARTATVIVPEPGPLATYVTDLHARMNVLRGKSLVAQGALTEAPTGGFVAYGSPASNRWLADVARAARWSIEADAITVDGHVFPGEHLALIAWWPVPDDPAAAMVVYTGAADVDLVGINRVFHGPWDWQVVQRTAAGFETIARGFFELASDGWRMPAD